MQNPHACCSHQALVESCVTRQQHLVNLSDATGKTVMVAHRKLCLKDHMEVSAWLHSTKVGSLGMC